MLQKKDPRVLRQHLLCALAAEQNLLLEDINMHSNPPGLLPEESRFLRLVEAITNGCKIMVAKGGTLLKFYAGMVTNNEGVELTFDCGKERAIAYYLEYLLPMAMLGKHPLTIHLHGLTDHPLDSSIDTFQQHLLPFLKTHYQLDNELALQIVSRGYLPNGGGHVKVVIPTVRKFPALHFPDKGYIKKVRGITAGSLCSTSLLNTLKDKSKSTLLNYLPDVWIHSDYYKGSKAGLSPGYSLSLLAETTTGAAISFDACHIEGTPQALAEGTVNAFLDEIEHAGVISTNYQWLLVTLMALSERKTSEVKLGRVSGFTVECLRVLREALGVVFEIEESKAENLAIFRCLGIGYENYSRIAK
jgi:RNA 3'-terminal phosphate cyclase-like protein